MDPISDLERFQLAHIKREIINLHDKEGMELMEYLTSLEGAFERQKLEFQKREAELKATRRELKRKLESSERKRHEYEINTREDHIDQIEDDESSFHQSTKIENGRMKERNKIKVVF
ncbi:hypothetical protein O6H91_14G057800 [Diphasiastrum complanatum]|uniref:Uncharacterized protein n=1 Tax=Diphasiastrum complanatum TaxID=34168 RepID=A0ACC2BPY5_DIPCM|nr:hypothetical protein O6H91_14G057800 [Diphasiastrum complanatum]